MKAEGIDRIRLQQDDIKFDDELLSLAIEYIYEYLSGLGLRKNDKVAIVSYDHIYIALLYYTLTQKGYVYVPINYNYSDE